MSADQFIRTRLVIGADGLARLAASRVAVFGIGGVGGSCIEALARAGAGALDIVDDDAVSVSNLNRQLIATHDTVGRKKTEAMAERIHSINPSCVVTAHDCFYLPETRLGFDFSAYDYVVDCIDTVTAKLDLVCACVEAGTPVISCMGMGNKLDPTRIEVGDISETSVCRLARIMRKELRRRGVSHLKCVYSTERPRKPDAEAAALLADELAASGKRSIPGSVPFVPPVAGMVLASAVVADLCGIEEA